MGAVGHPVEVVVVVDDCFLVVGVVEDGVGVDVFGGVVDVLVEPFL